jgi:hypothetical protein
LRCSLFEAWIDSFQIARPDVYAKVRNNWLSIFKIFKNVK